MANLTARNLSKQYKLLPHPKYLLRELIPSLNLPEPRVVWAVKDVNFELTEGSCCGVIGRNGSGKSTLLGLLGGLIAPTEGTVIAGGKISTLMEIGAGFNPEYSGRDNILMISGFLGFSRQEIQRVFDDIIRFSELDEDIDHPVKSYSSGMLLRLGFSVAIHLKFDILLIDEILSVGDMLFQRKCLKKIREYKEAGKIIVLASHNLSDIAEICDHVILLEKGEVIQSGSTEAVLSRYWQECERQQNKIQFSGNLFRPGDAYEDDTGEIKINDVQFLNKDGDVANTFSTGEKLTISIHFNAAKEITNPLFRVQFFRNDGLWVHGANTYRSAFNTGTLLGPGVIELIFPEINLLEADYFLSIGIWPNEYTSFIRNVAFDYHESAYVITITSKREDGAGIVYSPFHWAMKRI